jgi:hypothetical protein
MSEYELEISDDKINPFTTKIINQAKLVSKECGINLEEAFELMCKAMKSGNYYFDKGDNLI